MTKEYVVESLLFREISLFTSLDQRLSVRNFRSCICMSLLKFTTSTYLIIYDEKNIRIPKLVNCFAKIEFPEFSCQ